MYNRASRNLRMCRWKSNLYPLSQFLCFTQVILSTQIQCIFASFQRSFPLFPKLCRHKIVFLFISFSEETLHLETQSSESLRVSESDYYYLAVCVTKVCFPVFATKHCFCIPPGITSLGFSNLNQTC